MQISNRFSVAVHILLCVGTLGGTMKLTSEVLAGSVGVNPVVIRRILGALKKAGLVDVAAGTGGTRLKRPAAEISLLDVYLAVEAVQSGRLFSMHSRPNPQCPVGRSVHGILEGHMQEAQHSLERSLAGVSLKDLLEGVPL